MEREQTEPPMPVQLPLTAADCRTLQVWRTLVRGESQDQVAQRGRVKQARISEVELGKVMPRRRHWPALIAAFGLSNVPDAESQFYRMLMAARLERQRLAALPRPIADTEPLFAAAVTMPRPVLPLVVSKDEVEQDRRANA